MFKKLIEKIKDILKDGEAVRYIIIGLCTTAVNYLAFALLTEVCGLEVNLSNAAAIAVSIIFAYVANKLFVFRSHCKSFLALAAEFGKFVGARLITMAVEFGGVYVMYNLLSINEHIAKLSTQVVVIIGNYFISKLLVFTGKEEK